MKDYKNKSVRMVAEGVDFFGSIFGLFKKNKPLNKEDIKKIVILKFDRIGDTFLSLPTIEAIKKSYPNAKIIFFCAKWNKDVLDSNPFIDEIIVVDDLPNVQDSSILSFLDRKLIKKIKNRIAEVNPDLAVDLQGNPMNVLSIYQAKVPIRVGFKYKILSFLLTHKAVYNDMKPQSEIYFSLVKALCINDQMGISKIYYNADNLAKVDKLLSDNNVNDFVVFHLGAGRSYRQWPIENFSSLADKIIAKHNIKIVVIGVGNDILLFDQLEKKVSRPDMLFSSINLLDLKDQYYLLSRAKFFVGNESGPGHLAASLEVPMISFMNGWIDIERWKAQGPSVSILVKNVHDCKGPACEEKPCPSMAAITVDETFKIFENNFTYENSSSK